GGKILGEVRDHFRRGAPLEAGEVLVAVGSLDFPEQPLESVEVMRLELHLADARLRRGAAETAAAAQAVGRTGARIGIAQRRPAGKGRLRAALPPAPCQHGDERDQPELEHQAEERGESAEPAEQAMAEQQTEQSGAEEAGGKPAQQAGTVEEAAGSS